MLVWNDAFMSTHGLIISFMTAAAKEEKGYCENRGTMQLGNEYVVRLRYSSV